MQSRRNSFIEAATNVVVGIVVAWGVTFTIFPWFDLEPALVTSLWISLIFTAVSLARSYVLRRLFNWIEQTTDLADPGGSDLR
jgi:putative effector of murein hydrolase